MGILDEEIIQNAMNNFNLSREEAERQVQELIDVGLIERGIDNHQITTKGIEYVQNNLLKKRYEN